MEWKHKHLVSTCPHPPRGCREAEGPREQMVSWYLVVNGVVSPTEIQSWHLGPQWKWGCEPEVICTNRVGNHSSKAYITQAPLSPKGGEGEATSRDVKGG